MISVLLVKPDGVASDAKRAEIDRQAAAHQMTVLNRILLQLRASDIAAIWPKFNRPEHRFTLSMLRRYLTSGPSHLITVDADDVITRCVAVRSGVRDRFGWSAFENAIHTPADESERSSNLRHLAPSTLDGSIDPPPDTRAGAGAFGRFAMLADEEIEALTAELWHTKLVDEWSGLQEAPREPTALWLLPGSANSIDYEIAVLAETFEAQTLSWCAQRFVEAEIFGRAPLRTRSSAELAAVKRRLDSHGVITSGR